MLYSCNKSWPDFNKFIHLSTAEAASSASLFSISVFSLVTKRVKLIAPFLFCEKVEKVYIWTFRSDEILSFLIFFDNNLPAASEFVSVVVIITMRFFTSFSFLNPNNNFWRQQMCWTGENKSVLSIVKIHFWHFDITT